jgi:hypothetical protein
MKTLFTFWFALLLTATVSAQAFTVPDTLIIENFENDPTTNMLTVPSGDDLQWVNYDQDHELGLCVTGGATPYGWWQEGDFSVPNSNQTTNSAFTSCSYLADEDVRNANWLITSPVTIPDSSFRLCWRSLSYYGPGYVDGYHVLVSESSNDPDSFKVTLFAAAEMIANSAPVGSLDPADYGYSDGYLHADNYTDTTYFFLDYSEGPPFYHGRLEPHSVQLNSFAGKTIYIAFLHDSQNDFLLQIDDIVISNTPTSSTRTPDQILAFQVMPNPVRDGAYFSWSLKTAQESMLTVMDNSGSMVFQRFFSSRAEGLYFLETQQMEAGVYFCTLETVSGKATTKMIKL